MYWFGFFSGFIHQDDSFKSKIAMFNNNRAKEPPADPFQTEDPFKSDLFQGLNTFLYLFIIYPCVSVRINIILSSALLLVITCTNFVSLWISISTKYPKCTYIIDAKLWCFNEMEMFVICSSWNSCCGENQRKLRLFLFRGRRWLKSMPSHATCSLLTVLSIF